MTKDNLTDEQIIQILSKISAWWPNSKIQPKVTLVSYRDFFTHFPASAREIYSALLVLVSECLEFPPTLPRIHDIILKVRNYSTNGTTSGFNKAEDVWNKLVKIAQGGTPWEVLSNKLTKVTNHALECCGGYKRIRTADISTELPFVRKIFIDCYNSFIEEFGSKIAYEKAIKVTQLDNRIKKQIKMVGKEIINF